MSGEANVGGQSEDVPSLARVRGQRKRRVNAVRIRKRADADDVGLAE